MEVIKVKLQRKMRADLVTALSLLAALSTSSTPATVFLRSFLGRRRRFTAGNSDLNR